MPMSDQADERVSTADLTADRRDETSPTDGRAVTDASSSQQRDANEPLLSADDGRAFQQRWEKIQVSFVDEPQASVRDADSLVAELMQTLASTFAEERSRLEDEWERGAEVSTEDLRQALQHYRSFFRRLLTT
jgi:hypothetical protein